MNKAEIGTRIMKARIRRGLSTQQLAELIDKSQATVSRIENGKQGVGIELLNRLAQVLRVHPFSFLSDTPLRHSVLLPTGVAMRSDKPVRILPQTLQSGRMRARLTLKEAADYLQIPEQELEAIEMGYALPESGAIEKLAELYNLDEKELKELASMDKQYPRLSQRMCVMERLLSNVLALPATTAEQSRVSTDLRSEIEGCLGMAPGTHKSAERNASYFSIGHLTDTLLKALQDPLFHARVEAMARDHDGQNADAAAGATATPAPPSDAAIAAVTQADSSRHMAQAPSETGAERE